MLADDTAAFPMTFVMETQLCGAIKHEVLRESLHQAVERHPLFNCRVNGDNEWEPVYPLEVDAEFATGPIPAIRPEDERIDLKREVGLRCRAYTDGQNSMLRFHFHHSTTDGLGGCQFILDLLAFYHATIEGSQERLFRQIDSASLKTRGAERWGVLPRPVGYWESLATHLKQAWQLLTTRPQPIKGSKPSALDSSLPTFSELILHTFDELETAQIRETSKRHQVTVNDLLIATLFQVLQMWRKDTERKERGLLRILIPTSLRFVSDRVIPAANLIGYIFAERRPDASTTLEELLSGVTGEMSLAREWRMGNLFVDNLRFAAKTPGLQRFFTTAVSCFATSILTNLGDPSRGATARLPRRDGKVVAGNLVVRSLTGAPPLRDRTNCVFSVADYNRQLTIGSRANESVCGEGSAQALLQKFVAQLRENVRHLREASIEQAAGNENAGTTSR